MNSRQYELNKIETYKVNWYALVACICSEKNKSVSSACRGLGLELNHEKTEISAYKDSNFDLKEVKELIIGIFRYKKFKM